MKHFFLFAVVCFYTGQNETLLHICLVPFKSKLEQYFHLSTVLIIPNLQTNTISDFLPFFSIQTE